MTNDGLRILTIISLIAFAALSQPLIFIAWKHGRPGILGWLLVHLLCTIRTIGAIIELKALSNNTENSTLCIVVNSVGLSPLLLGTLGILHEARRARNPSSNKVLEWTGVLSIHGSVTLGLIMVVIGIVQIEKTHQEPNTSPLIKVGLVIVVLAWCTILGWAVWSLRGERHADARLYDSGSRLLKGVLAGLPFIGVRLVYAILIFTVSDYQKFSNSIALKYCMDLIPEVITASILVAVGCITRNMWKEKVPTSKIETSLNNSKDAQAQTNAARPYENIS